jgi:hypothetical protein
MKAFDKQTWSQIRAKGRAHFVVRQIVRRGIPMGIFVTLGVFILHIFTHSVTPALGNLAAIFICFGLAFGYIGGEREWQRCERAYNLPPNN